MTIEEFIIEFNYFYKMKDLMGHGYSSEVVSKHLTEEYMKYLSDIREKKLEEILKD